MVGRRLCKGNSVILWITCAASLGSHLWSGVLQGLFTFYLPTFYLPTFYSPSSRSIHLEAAYGTFFIGIFSGERRCRDSGIMIEAAENPEVFCSFNLEMISRLLLNIIFHLKWSGKNLRPCCVIPELKFAGLIFHFADDASERAVVPVGFRQPLSCPWTGGTGCSLCFVFDNRTVPFPLKFRAGATAQD